VCPLNSSKEAKTMEQHHPQSSFSRSEHPPMNPKQQGYLSIELLWRSALPWAEPPNRIFMSNWYNLVQGDVSKVLEVIETVSQLDDCADPSHEVWRRLRRSAPIRI